MAEIPAYHPCLPAGRARQVRTNNHSVIRSFSHWVIMNDVNEILDQVLAILRRKSVDAYEIYLDQSSHFYVESKEGKVDTFQSSEALGMAFRILNGHRMGFSYTTSVHPSSSIGEDGPRGLEQVVDDAIHSAESTFTDPCFDFAPALGDIPPAPPIFDETFESVPDKAKIEKAKLLEESVRSVDPRRIKKVRKASYEEVLSRTTLVNSNRLRLSYASTFASLGVTAVAEESGESEVGWNFDFSHFPKELDAARVGQEAGRKALERLGGKRIPSGVYPVLLRNYVASEFLSLLGHSFLSEQIQKGKSLLKGKKGERFLSPLLSIVDDGLYPKGISTSPIDGEGTASQRTPLVTQGEVLGYLYDRYWANREKASLTGSPVRSTGNSRRSSIKSPPGIGISNFFIEPGSHSFSKLVEDLHQGVVIEEVMGLHTVDPISGDFSLGFSGDWVDGGKKVYPIKSIAVAGNLFRLFRDLRGLGEDLKFFGRVGSPSLLIEGLEVSGS
jgi:PmbA protein